MQSNVSIWVDQTVHGYERGHRELRSSIRLDEDSRATMLQMSDLLAQRTLADEESYLTCYPLLSAKRHVLARTWGAGAKYRPGSVWTHSLVLDYQALALLPDLTVLTALLKRPEANLLEEFSSKLLVSSCAPFFQDFGFDPRADFAIHKIYGESQVRQIELPRLSSASDESLAMALWRQMWPGLRREFLFFTSGGHFIPAIKSECSLCFSSDSWLSRNELPPKSSHRGVEALVRDLSNPGPTSLRTFLARYAIESAEPRRVALELSAALGLFDESRLPIEIDALYSLAERESLSRLKRDVVTESLNRAMEPEDLFTAIGKFKDEVIEVDLRDVIARALLMPTFEIRRLLEGTCTNHGAGIGAQIFEKLVQSLDLSVLASVSTQSNRLPIAKIRPEVLKQSDFWPGEDEERAALISHLSDEHASDVAGWLKVFGQRIGPLSVSALLARANIEAVDSVVTLLENDDPKICETAAHWILSSAACVERLALSEQGLGNRALESLANSQITSGERYVALNWPRLVHRLLDENGVTLGCSTLIVAFEAAINLKSQESLDLAKAVYDPLQQAVTSYKLSNRQADYLKKMLPDSRRSWTLYDSVTRNAVQRWPSDSSKLGALEVSNKAQHLESIIYEIVNSQGIHILELILQRDDVSSELRSMLKRRLDQAKKTKSIWWW